jgi:hypothetical protein
LARLSKRRRVDKVSDFGAKVRYSLFMGIVAITFAQADGLEAGSLGLRLPTFQPHASGVESDAAESLAALQCIELAADEKTLLAFEPISRIVPTTITRMTASITAYSAMS